MLGKKGNLSLFNKNLVWDTEMEIIKFPVNSKHTFLEKNFKWDILTLYLSRNIFFQQICGKMMQYCAFWGTSNKELIKIAIKDLRLFETMKTKKSERIFIIQEKCKKNSIPPIFFSIYNLNEVIELDRSFIYFKTSMECTILGLCLLTFGDIFMSKLIYRILSFFLSSDSIECSSFAVISTSFLFVSDSECPAIDFMIKLLGNFEFITVKNSLFSLGIIGAGTQNTRIKNALKWVANYYNIKLENSRTRKKSKIEEDDFQFFRKIKSIIFLIRLSQGLVNSFYRNLSVCVDVGLNSEWVGW